MGSRISVLELGLPRLAARPLWRVLALDRLEAVYRVVAARPVASANKGGTAAGEFCKRALAALEIGYRSESERILRLREIEGPIIFVANHPFGGVDALILMTVMSEIRADFRFMGNAILRHFPELEPILLAVHVREKDARPGKNFSVLRKTVRYLSRGGAIGIFPSGEVAELPNVFASRTVEGEWSAHLGMIVKKSRATVVPIYFHGQTRALTRYGGYLFPFLRIALLAREILKARTEIRYELGEPISSDDPNLQGSAEQVTRYLRARTVRSSG